MLYNKKTIPTALTITGGFTILKTQRRLTTEKYATIGGSMVHILICDDDAAFAQDMAKKIQALPAYSPKSMNVQLLTDVTAMSAGVLTKFDILFLDIDLGNKNGIELARIMREHNAEAVLILVTNFSEYAPEGYEVNAFRYLSKAELDRKLPGYFSDALAVCRTRKRKVEIFCEGESMSVPVQAISYAESQGHEQCLYMIGWSKEKLYTRLTMAQLEELLFPQGFLRIHIPVRNKVSCIMCKGQIVNGGSIDSLRGTQFNGNIIAPFPSGITMVSNDSGASHRAGNRFTIKARHANDKTIHAINVHTIMARPTRPGIVKHPIITINAINTFKKHKFTFFRFLPIG